MTEETENIYLKHILEKGNMSSLGSAATYGSLLSVNTVLASHGSLSNRVDLLNKLANHQINLQQNTPHSVNISTRNVSGNSSFYITALEMANERILTSSIEKASRDLIDLMKIDYITEISKRKIKLLKLAINNSINNIFIWAEIEANDDESELGLLRCESIVNGKYYNNTGISISSTIVEDIDKLAIPSDYEVIVNTTL